MSEEQRTTVIIQRSEQPYNVKLKRNARGAYSWEISVAESNPDGVLYALDYLEGELRKRFLGGESCARV